MNENAPDNAIVVFGAVPAHPGNVRDVDHRIDGLLASEGELGQSIFPKQSVIQCILAPFCNFGRIFADFQFADYLGNFVFHFNSSESQKDFQLWRGIPQNLLEETHEEEGVYCLS